MIRFPASNAPADGVAFSPDLLQSLPPPPTGDLLAELEAAWTTGRDSGRRRVIVVDDDPTGTQTVSGAGLVTSWTSADLNWLLDRPERIGFVLTNSRAVNQQEAVETNQIIGTRLRAAAGRRNLQLDVVSRSDSTLRGHFPAELEALAGGLQQDQHGTLVVPYFGEGGRITINGAHYALQGEAYVPAAETPFAQDSTFGYHRSFLPAWIEEKTEGRVAAASVAVIDIGVIRIGGIDSVTEVLLDTMPTQYVTIDAVVPADLQVVVAAVRRAEHAGRRWRYRSAAGLIPPLAGLDPPGPVDPPRPAGGRGGLVVVGSHVPLSTTQLEALLGRPKTTAIEARVSELASPAAASEIGRLQAAASEALDQGRTTVVFTSREVVVGPKRDTALAIGRHAADGLSRLVAGLPRPAYLVAKGGITSHTLAVDGLAARRAEVLGPILPGVPMWAMDERTRFPGLPFVVFPGNVGGPNSLVDVVDRLESARR